ncbi:MAG TPA: polysaccharide pyruvyl transferase family protein [Candidatus Angelobacter sp.]|nr:polysaccharide pyruvyl transferase family protein [Candidatus Angelobacter sp.]
MKRLLVRSPKDPFEVVSPRQAYHRNLIGDNAGNLVFLQATHRILRTSDQVCEPGGFSVDPPLARTVNETFDAYVMPLANAFRAQYEPKLKRMIRFLERLTIPVVILGVGAQSDPDLGFERLKPMEPSIRRFMTAALDRGPVVGVRGEMTAEYLFGLGFRDVEVIGCPSMFLHGDRIEVTKRVAALDRNARVSINISPYVAAMGPISVRHAARYPNLVYVPQDLETLGALIRGGGWSSSLPPDDPVPLHSAHPLFAGRRARFHVEPWPWIDDLATRDFSFGTRIHGNIAAILAGTPAYVFAHDSRTLELARYFEIPHRLMRDVPPDIDAADLHAEADYTALTTNHARRFAVFAAYLARHGLRHVWLDGEDPAAFMDRVRATRYPAAVTVPDAMLRPRSVAGRAFRARHAATVAGWQAADWVMGQLWRARRLVRRVRRRLV